jgi:DNA-binding FadR family transcriptional regulator
MILGSEAQLLDRYGVSRPTLREAIRLLEHRQIVSMRRGPGGGLSVTAPDSSAVAGAAIAYLEFAHVNVQDLVESLTILQPMAAALAAMQIDEDGIVRLRRLVSTQDASAQWDQHNRFHGELAAMSRNPALELFIAVSTELISSYTSRALADRQLLAAEIERTKADIARAQSRLAEAVIQGNAPMAEHIATLHLTAMLSWVQETGARLAAAVATTPVDNHGGTASRHRVTAPKMATALAERIRRDIRRSGWIVGANLGSEPSLQQRYQVSRTVLREAVRLLEYQGVASMHTGRSGGLVVSEPHPDAVAAAVTLYLSHRDVRGHGLAAVQLTIEVGCLDIVAGRFDERARDALRDLMAAELAAAPGSPSLEKDFHTHLAELTGNPVLSLWTRVLYSLRHEVGRPDDVGERAVSDPEHERDAREAHAGIANALLDGDPALARHRMRRHLQRL